MSEIVETPIDRLRLFVAEDHDYGIRADALRKEAKQWLAEIERLRAEVERLTGLLRETGEQARQAPAAKGERP